MSTTLSTSSSSSEGSDDTLKFVIEDKGGGVSSTPRDQVTCDAAEGEGNLLKLDSISRRGRRKRRNRVISFTTAVGDDDYTNTINSYNNLDSGYFSPYICSTCYNPVHSHTNNQTEVVESLLTNVPQFSPSCCSSSCSSCKCSSTNESTNLLSINKTTKFALPTTTPNKQSAVMMQQLSAKGLVNSIHTTTTTQDGVVVVEVSENQYSQSRRNLFSFDHLSNKLNQVIASKPINNACSYISSANVTEDQLSNFDSIRDGESFSDCSSIQSDDNDNEDDVIEDIRSPFCTSYLTKNGLTNLLHLNTFTENSKPKHQPPVSKTNLDTSNVTFLNESQRLANAQSFNDDRKFIRGDDFKLADPQESNLLIRRHKSKSPDISLPSSSNLIQPIGHTTTTKHHFKADFATFLRGKGGEATTAAATTTTTTSFQHRKAHRVFSEPKKFYEPQGPHVTEAQSLSQQRHQSDTANNQIKAFGTRLRKLSDDFEISITTDKVNNTPTSCKFNCRNGTAATIKKKFKIKYVLQNILFQVINSFWHSSS